MQEIVIENGVRLIKTIFYYGLGREIAEEHYVLDGDYHRENNPAIICYYREGSIAREFYYKNGKLHREDGAAKILYSRNGYIETKRYYLNDEEITDEFQLLVVKGLEK